MGREPSRFTDLPGPPRWAAQAACLTADPGLFFPAEGEDGSEAKAVCRSCPVRVPCLKYALEPYIEGIWGGYTQRSRRRVARLHAAGRPLEDIIAASDLAASAVREPDLARAAGNGKERKRATGNARRAAARAGRHPAA